MKQQLWFAFKLLTFSGAYLFTRSRTPRRPLANRFPSPEKSLAVLFILENLKRVFINNARLIKYSKNEVEVLENDIRFFKALLEDCAKRSNKDEDLKKMVGEIHVMVAEAEVAVVVFKNQAAENENRNFFQRAFGGQTKLISVAKEVGALRAKVKNLYDKSRDVFYRPGYGSGDG